MGETPHILDRAAELERADLLLMIELANEQLVRAEEMKALVFKYPDNKDFRKIYDRLMEELGRDWSDIAALVAELEHDHYTLPDQGPEKSFRL